MKYRLFTKEQSISIPDSSVFSFQAMKLCLKEVTKEKPINIITPAETWDDNVLTILRWLFFNGLKSKIANFCAKCRVLQLGNVS